MLVGEYKIVDIFIKVIEAILIEHDIECALGYFSDDVIGIGMGSQGAISNKNDLIRIIDSMKTNSSDEKPVIEYSNVQVRCYAEKFATACALLKIKNQVGGKDIISTLGQMINFVKKDEKWLICSMQATPVFDQIEEMEAYPFKFAENILEKYRQQEQIAKNAQSNNVAIYMIDFTKGIFLDSIVKSDGFIQTKKGDEYEEAILNSQKYMNNDDSFNFVSTFSIKNIFNSYENGITELSTEYEMFSSKDKSNWYKAIIKLYIDEIDNSLKGYLYIIDINDMKKRELYLQSKTEIDLMTGLYNKKYSEIKISQKLRSIYPPQIDAFFMIDLDCFKNINDTFGHHKGDWIIKEAANLLLKMTAENDIAGRIGGDEFCVYLTDIRNTESIIEKAEYLCSSISQLALDNIKGVSCSIGIVICTHCESFEEVYKKADTALYHKKRNGRNGYCIYSEQ